MRHNLMMLGVCLTILFFSGCAYQSALHTGGQTYSFRVAIDSHEDE